MQEDIFTLGKADIIILGSQNVPQEDIRFILDAARLAPSSLGLEPWKFLVVQNPEQKEKIAQIAYGQSHIKNCNFIVILLSRLDFKDYFVDRMKKRNLPAERFEKTVSTYLPFLEAMDERKKIAYAEAQNHLAMMQMVLAASSKKVDSCIIGGFDHEALDSYGSCPKLILRIWHKRIWLIC